MSYKAVSLSATALCIALFVCLLVAPDLIYWLFGVASHATADLLAKRAAILFLGLAVLSFMGRNAPPSSLRHAVTVAMATVMGGLMLVGMYEFFSGTAGLGIWLAIGGEALFLGLYLNLLFTDPAQHNDGMGARVEHTND